MTIPDAWTLIHLSIIHLQPLSEAFDDDVSGFVTVAEANAFTTLRPLEWRSVLRHLPLGVLTKTYTASPIGSLTGLPVRTGRIYYDFF